MRRKKRALKPQKSLIRLNEETTVARLAAIPEEAIWLSSLKSPRTRRAYQYAVQQFMHAVKITSLDELRRIDHRAAMLWERRMREDEKLESSTIRQRLAALSSLFDHLVRFGAVENNPFKHVKRPAINRREGMTPAFSAKQARKILDSPAPDTLIGIRDRALLSVAFQVGLRRSEIAWLIAGDLHINMGYDALRVRRKGGRRGVITINQHTKNRITAYLEMAGHADDLDGPLFRPVRKNQHAQEERRHLNDKEIYRIVRKYVRKAGINDRGFSAHSTRATFITEALRNGASIEDVQAHVGHADISTTKLYDRRRLNPEQSPTFYVNY